MSQELFEASELASTTDLRKNKVEGESQPCVHCGEQTLCPVDQNPQDVFCCQGCRGAYQLIHGLGLEAFYELRQQADAENSCPVTSQSDFEKFDNANFLGSSVPTVDEAGNGRSKLALQGLHCAACCWLIENGLQSQRGVISARVRMNDHSLELVFDPQKTALSRLARLLDRLGYALKPWAPDSRAVAHKAENRRLLTQIAIAGFLAANAMWIAIALYAGASATAGYFLGLMGTLLGVIAVLGPGRVFLTGAMASLRTRTPHMDLPVALGLWVATLVGVFNAIAGVGDVYFDSAAMLVFLLLIGRWLKYRQQQQASKSVDLMLRLLPQTARRIDEPEEFSVTDLVVAEGSEVVAAESLQAGDWVEVHTGESLPADGLLRAVPESKQPTARLDCSLLSGESKPVRKQVGDQLYAGSVNAGGKLLMQVTAAGASTRMGGVVRQVETAASQRIPIVLLADRIGGVFVVVVSLLAVMTFWMWLPEGASHAAAHATALLIVACPCALALATPLAVANAIGRAAKRGILIRDGGVFQRLSKPGVVWLDKTGTLTTSGQQVTSVIGSEEGLRLASVLEKDCSHPTAQAIREAVVSPQATESRLQHVCTWSNGRSGVVDGHTVLIGNPERITNEACEISAGQRDSVAELAAAGESPSLIARDGKVITILGISNPILANAERAVARLKFAGWKVGILSGDHPEIVERVGRKLGIAPERCLGGRTPEDKLAVISQSKAENTSTVVMVGDGANDAAALAAADVGVAVRGGVEASLHAAPVILARGVSSLSKLLNAARRTQSVVLQTFVISLAYNLLAVSLAMLGWISPLLAAVFMPLSSLSVLSIVLATRTFKEDAA